LGGLFFDGPELPLGNMVTVTVDLGARGMIKLLAQVRHHSVTRRGMGLQFTRLDPVHVDTLQRLIAQLTR
jgi:c-di-GMP-binding flagellar brake protein YcgR